MFLPNLLSTASTTSGSNNGQGNSFLNPAHDTSNNYTTTNTKTTTTKPKFKTKTITKEI